jgi:hypothetical protein
METYIDSKEAEYLTQVGVAGELILYRITLHQMLSAKTQPQIWKVWAADQWQHMVHDEVEVDDDEKT